jgi:hypothetical protein
MFDRESHSVELPGREPLPPRASVTIIGGGVMGVSTALHLARAGVGGILVIERDLLGSGSSAKPLGGVRATFSDPGNILLAQRSLEAYERFGAEFGVDIGLRQVGYLFLCRTENELVGFYDLRDASKSSVPVVSTAFRPIEADELARNPFRVFTSMLVSNDRRFFNEATQDRLEAFISQRQLFSPRLLELADLSTTQHGLAPMHATEFLDLATAAFKLSDTPSTGSGTDTWRASRPSLPTSAGSRQPTSTTSHPACWTSTSSIAAWRHAASS